MLRIGSTLIAVISIGFVAGACSLLDYGEQQGELGLRTDVLAHVEGEIERVHITSDDTAVIQIDGVVHHGGGYEPSVVVILFEITPQSQLLTSAPDGTATPISIADLRVGDSVFAFAVDGRMQLSNPPRATASRIELVSP